MLRLWFKFILWTIIIGVILRFITTRIIREPFWGLMATIYGGREYLFMIIQIIIGGFVLGSIIFGIWYLFVGRRRKK